MDNPLVTCLCLTHNRREWLPSAVECFLNQTYANRELLIVADGEPIKDLLPDDERIRVIYTEKRMKIGPKRNVGCAAAEGSIIVHMDDDDYSAPRRIRDQVERLLASGKAVTGYNALKFTDGEKLWRYDGVPCFAVGTSLMYRRDWALAHPFEDRQIMEDSLFTAVASQSRQLSWADGGEMLYASIHGGNTSPRNLAGGYEEIPWKRGEREALDWPALMGAEQ